MTTSSLQPRNVVRLKALQRASRRLDVVRVSDRAERYIVSSASQPGRFYNVQIDPEALTGQCTCQWAQYGGVNCKHVLAVLRACFAARGALSFWDSPEAAQRQHRPIIAGEHLLATLRRASAGAPHLSACQPWPNPVRVAQSPNASPAARSARQQVSRPASNVAQAEGVADQRVREEPKRAQRQDRRDRERGVLIHRRHRSRPDQR